MKIKIGVIIQGPLITYGQGPNNSIDGFDTFDTIVKNCENISKYGLEYLVSTWTPNSNEEKVIYKRLAEENIHITINDLPKIFDPDHRYKQRYGTLLGIEKLSLENNIDFLVKIRTDMFFPNDFWEWIVNIANNHSSDIMYISQLMNLSFYMGDFIYAGKTKVLLDFIKTILSYNSSIIHPSIAFDDGIKFLQQKSNFKFQKDIFQILNIFYMFVINKNFTRSLWNNFIDMNIGNLPKNIWVDILWRDRRIGDFLDPSLFKFDTLPILTDNTSYLKNSQMLLEDYRRYSNKSGKKYWFVEFYKVISKIKQLVNMCLHILIKLLYTPKSYLGRVACVGKDTFLMKNKNIKNIQLVNLQKARLDLLIDWFDGKPRPKSEVVKIHMLREDVFPLIEQQESLDWLKFMGGDIEYLIIDSYSELTDQRFTHRNEGWSFCCHYTDLKHTLEFENEFECNGLLNINQFEVVYRAFFDWFEKTFPNKKVIFIHYSTQFDQRQEFKEREKEIARIITVLSKEKPYLIDLALDKDFYKPREEDEWPYHYSNDTYNSLVKKWEGIIGK